MGPLRYLNLVYRLSKIERNQAKMSQTLDALNTNIASLQTTSDAVLAALQSANQDPAIQAAADQVAAIDAKLKAGLPQPPTT